MQVVKYWPEIGKSGFLVWRYLLRRDDVEPAPWTPEGKDRTKKLALKIQVGAYFFLFPPLMKRYSHYFNSVLSLMIVS